jgi:hypothetical protein
VFIALLLRLAIDLPGQPKDYPKPPSALAPSYIEVLEENTHLIYPVLGLLAVLLIAAGVMQALKTDDLSGIEKAEIKRDLVRELRGRVTGYTAEELAKRLGIANLRMLKVLEQMAQEGVLEAITDSHRHTTWRLKGLLDPHH